MSNTIHAFDALQAKAPKPVPLIALFGDERFLQSLVIKRLVQQFCRSENQEFGVSYLTGDSAAWIDVHDELAAKSLFGGGGPKVVVLQDADRFVKKYRDHLEDYLKKPAATGCLILVVSTWPSNTKLYKALDKSGLQIDCGPPVVKRGRGKARDDQRICKWLSSWSRSQYEFELKPDAAQQLLETGDCDFGMLDQQLAKLSLFADGGSISAADVHQYIGGWRTQTVWQAVDAATEGNAGEAIRLLGQLLQSGEHPLALFGQLSWSLRRYGEVWEILARATRDGKRLGMQDAIKQAGFRAWGGELAAAETRLKQLGRDRVRRILSWLVEVDLSLKGTHSHEKRARLALETLFTQMARQPSPAR